MDVCPSNIWGLYTSKIFDGCGSVNYLGVYTPEIFDGCGSVKYLGGLHPPKYLTDVDSSTIWGVYIFFYQKGQFISAKGHSGPSSM